MTSSPRGRRGAVQQAPRAPAQRTGEDQAEQVSRRLFTMHRSVAQLLFSYLPEKTIDWENGVGIMQLKTVHLSSAWDESRARLVLDEIADYLQRWRDRGGLVEETFPDLPRQRRRFTLGAPASIDAELLDAALQCLSCSRLVFTPVRALAKQDQASHPFQCPSCAGPLRQFPQVFVHGCGHMVTVSEFMPAMKRIDGGWARKSAPPLRCPACGPLGIPEIKKHSERAKDLIVTCRRCHGDISGGRLSARCPECVRLLARGALPTAPQMSTDGQMQSGSDAQDGHAHEPTAVTRVAMRVTSYRASEAYYAHSLTILRLDRDEVGYEPSAKAEIETLRQLIPTGGQGPQPADTLDLMTRLLTEAREARDRGDIHASDMLKAKAMRIGRGEQPDAGTAASIAPLRNVSPEIMRSIRESLALKTRVHTRPYSEVLASAGDSATAGLLGQLEARHRALGLHATYLVEDLPVITATFGYTRRSSEPTYEEYDGSTLPTQIRSFPPLDAYAAKQIAQPRAQDNTPVLAREGEHEGLFFALDPERVMRWLELNGMRLPEDGRPPIARILDACEDVDRYYDDIFDRELPKPIRRLVFGLVHTLSHAVMRLVSQSAGLERTSISEYVFLPLLGTVVYANSGTFRMGAMDTLLRSNFYEVLERLADDTMDCLFDPDCLDHRGACAGCLHSPEISCRVFNHGLSRAFLRGGHAPWEDAATDKRIVGYWDEW